MSVALPKLPFQPSSSTVWTAPFTGSPCANPATNVGLTERPPVAMPVASATPPVIPGAKRFAPLAAPATPVSPQGITHPDQVINRVGEATITREALGNLLLKHYDMTVAASHFNVYELGESTRPLPGESRKACVNRLLDRLSQSGDASRAFIYFTGDQEAAPVLTALARAQADYFNATDQLRIGAPQFGTENFTLRDLKRVIDEFNDTETLKDFLGTFTVGWEKRLTFNGSWTELKNSLAKQIVTVPGAADFFVRKAAVWIGANGIPNHHARKLFQHAGLVDLSEGGPWETNKTLTKEPAVFTFGPVTVTEYDLWNIFRTIPAGDILALAANELGTRGHLGDMPEQAVRRFIDALKSTSPENTAIFFDKLKLLFNDKPETYATINLLVVRLRQKEIEINEWLTKAKIVFGVESPDAPLLQAEETLYDKEITVTRGEFAAAFGNVLESEYFEITSALQNLGVTIPRGDLADAFNASWAQLANNAPLMEQFLAERYHATQSSETKAAISVIIGKIRIIHQRQQDAVIPAAAVHGVTLTRGDVARFVAGFESLEDLYAFKFDATHPEYQAYVPDEVLDGSWLEVRKAYTAWLLANPQMIPAVYRAAGSTTREGGRLTHVEAYYGYANIMTRRLEGVSAASPQYGYTPFPRLEWNDPLIVQIRSNRDTPIRNRLIMLGRSVVTMSPELDLLLKNLNVTAPSGLSREFIDVAWADTLDAVSRASRYDAEVAIGFISGVLARISSSAGKQEFLNLVRGTA